METKEFTTAQELETILEASTAAYKVFSRMDVTKRARLLEAIADEMNENKNAIVLTASRETHLPESRIESEFERTLHQLRSYAQNCRAGIWMDVRIDTKDSEVGTTPNDLRKTMLGLGPVVVFGASNFPLAYSTAGGDTACALAAGCSVIVKAHNAHLETSILVSKAINKAIENCGLPKGLYAHVIGDGNETGTALVKHSKVKAVGFTGSYGGGMALYKLANERKEPIPVFAEMGSVNPVYLFPNYLKQNVTELAEWYTQSVTTSMGQFCTNPGIIIGVDSEALNKFLDELSNGVNHVNPAPMLHKGIAASYKTKRGELLAQPCVKLVTENKVVERVIEGIPTIAKVKASEFIANAELRDEVFGPLSLVVICKNLEEMQDVATVIEGQLTSTVIGEVEELRANSELIEAIKEKCGRLVFNGVPTGVQVSLAQNHGGPFPATTDSRFTAVGGDGIKRFARPITYQNYPNEMLPLELQNDNPLGIVRMRNGQYEQ